MLELKSTKLKLKKKRSYMEEKEGKAVKVTEIMSENFQNLAKDINLHTQ